jgi:hypothetical protein
MDEKEKQKIRNEEIFRDEVRKKLSDSSSSKLNKFVNSPLFIWFISTIVIGIFSYFFQKNDFDRKIHFQREKSISKIDVEIESRISQFWINLKPYINNESKRISDFKFTKQLDSLKFANYWNVFKNAPSLNLKSSSNIYPEYANRNTVSLMIEQINNLKDQQDLALDFKYSGRLFNYNKEKLTLKDSIVIEQVFKMRHVANFILSDKIFVGKFDTMKPIEVWKTFKNNIIIDRWNKDFPYTSIFINWHRDTSDL